MILRLKVSFSGVFTLSILSCVGAACRFSRYAATLMRGILYFCFCCLGLGRKKRNHVQLQYHLCSHAAEKQLEYCLNKLGGFKFRQKCTYRTAYCYYIVDCSHNPNNAYNRKYYCDEVVHRLNVRNICCEAIC